MKIERSSITIHLTEGEYDALEFACGLLDDIGASMREGETIESGDFEATENDIKKVITTLDVIATNAVVD